MVTTISNALVPVFFVMVLGYFAGRKKIVDNLNVQSLNSVVMKFALPISLFVAMAQTPAKRLSASMSLGLVLTLGMFVTYAVTSLLNRRVFGKSPSETAVQALNVGFPNNAAIGLPLLGAVVGPEGSMSVSVALAAGSVFLVPLTLTVLEGQAENAGNISHLRRIARSFLRAIARPLVIGPLAGVILALTGNPLPKLVADSFNLLGQATAGIALFVTGLILSSQPLNLNANVALGVLLKNIVNPLVVLGFGVAIGLKPHEMGEAILLAAIPCGFFGVLTGLSYGVKSQDANSTLTLTTIASSVTLAVVIILTNGMK